MKIVEFKAGSLPATVIGYLHDNISSVCKAPSLNPALVICPGGGYQHLSPREADPVAFRFLSRGINTFILNYSIGDEIDKEKPIMELAATVSYIKKHAEKLGVDKNRVGVMGFSAGGHLAASLAVHHASPALKAYPECRPSLAVLGYPVITAGEYAHRGSFDNLCRSSEELEFYSLEKQVDSDTVPCYIFHTANDGSVPVENSLVFALALSKHKIPYEMHIFQEGIHGISIATNSVGTPSDRVGEWCDEAFKWMSNIWGYVE